MRSDSTSTTRDCDQQCRSLIAVLLAALMLLTSNAAVRADDAKPIFPVMAWDGPPNDLAYLKRMRDCGFTVAGFVPVAALDNCQAAGLKGIVNDAAISSYDWHKVDADAARKNIEPLVAKTRNHPAVFGYYLRDEPPSGMFGGLATVANIIKELHPGVWPYINLFPTYANAGQLEVATYQAYLDKFIETCKPPILSYDHYALMEDGGFSEAYFTNLDIMRKTAVAHDLPFWNIIQGQGCLNFREPTEIDFRFQVFTSLAYGAKGIAYFQYQSSNVGNFRGSAVDHFGHETQAWSWLRNVNLQIEKLAPTLLKLKSDRAYHLGGVPAGCEGPTDNDLVTSASGPVLIGEFTHEDGTRYVMLVNKSFSSSIYPAPRFRAPGTTVELISNYTGEASTFDGEAGWLAPGQGALLKLKTPAK